MAAINEKHELDEYYIRQCHCYVKNEMTQKKFYSARSPLDKATEDTKQSPCLCRQAGLWALCLCVTLPK
jgi:hypothetical protein